MALNTHRQAFTMIEILFVIVVLGIIGTLTLDTIRQYYENIFRSQEYSQRVAEADHILEQVSKYFENAISVSIVNLDRNSIADNNCYGPPLAGDNNDYTVAFVAPDIDTMQGIWDNTLGRYRPGWNEDVSIIENNVSAFDSTYNGSHTIINTFKGTHTLNLSALYDTDSADVNACARFNWDGVGGIAGFHSIVDHNDSTLVLNAANLPTTSKRKYLIRTGYAFRVINNADGEFRLYTNFRPWLGERYSGANADSYLLGRNVAHFYADYNVTDFANNPNITDRGLVWRLKVCMRGLDANVSARYSDDESVAICRERRVHVRY